MNLPWFKEAPIILFLNKDDIFRKKIRSVDIGVYFPAYNGPLVFQLCISCCCNGLPRPRLQAAMTTRRASSSFRRSTLSATTTPPRAFTAMSVPVLPQVCCRASHFDTDTAGDGRDQH